jgi:hypothetical protein
METDVRVAGQPRGLVVSVSDYSHEVPVSFPGSTMGTFSLIGEDPHGDYGLGC